MPSMKARMLPDANASAARAVRISERPDQNVLTMLRRIEPVALILVTAMSAFTLALWIAGHIPDFVSPRWTKMVANTSIGLLLASCALSNSVCDRSKPLIWAGQAAGAGVFIIGVWTLVEYATDTTFWIDTLFPVDIGSRYPGRPSPQTAAGFTFLGSTLVMMPMKKRGWLLCTDLFALVFAIFCLVEIAGYLFGANALYAIGPATLLSPQTLICFSCLAFVVMAECAKSGPILSILVSDGIGSHIIRIVLPVIVLLPFAMFAIASVSIDAGKIATAYAYAFVTAFESLCGLCIALWMAWRINVLDKRLRDMALTDDLTKVYNRRGFYLLGRQMFTTAVRTRGSMGVFVCDLDGLKRVNDAAGHEAGSTLIASLAGLLVRNLRECDVVGRVGGDEFAVVMSGDSQLGLAAIERLIEATRKLNQSPVQVFPVEFSIGTAFLSSDTRDFDELVERADQMMYEDKAGKKEVAGALTVGHIGTAIQSAPPHNRSRDAAALAA